MTDRDAWVEIDLSAIRHNLAQVRRLAGSARIYVVCKGHAYGFDAATVARVAAEERADALAVGDPADAVAIRRAGVDLPILVYGSTRAESLPALAADGTIVTAHDDASLAVCLAAGLRFSLKLDCGFGRLGFRERDLAALLDAARAHPRASLHGVYTHLADTEDDASVARQVAVFARIGADLERAGWKSLERMVASSRVLIAHPELALDAVNPGRMIYGVLDPEWAARVDTRPALHAVKTRIVSVKRFARGESLGYAGAPLAHDATVAVIPYGFSDGYPRRPDGGEALVRGVRVPIVGMRHTEHTILDVSGVPGATLGDEVVLLGAQGEERIGLDEIERLTGVPNLELAARLARGPNRRHLR
jgi:alanine racemase